MRAPALEASWIHIACGEFYFCRFRGPMCVVLAFMDDPHRSLLCPKNLEKKMKNPLFDVSSWLHIAGIAHSRLRKFSHRSSHLPSRNGAVLCGVLQKLFKMFSCLFYSIGYNFQVNFTR